MSIRLAMHCRRSSGVVSISTFWPPWEMIAEGRRLVVGIAAGADFAVTPDQRHARAGAGAEKEELDLIHATLLNGISPARQCAQGFGQIKSPAVDPSNRVWSACLMFSLSFRGLFLSGNGKSLFPARFPSSAARTPTWRALRRGYLPRRSSHPIQTTWSILTWKPPYIHLRAESC